MLSNDQALQARLHMIESQLMTGRVLDSALLGAVAAVPREQFVPDRFRLSAYVDEEIELCRGRFLMEPLVFARMLELAEIKPTDKVLVVGANTGYATAVASRLAAMAIAVEEQKELAEKARQLFKKLSITNAEIVTGAHVLGYAPAASYQVILVEGGVQTLPDTLTAQLAEGGRLVAVENLARRVGSPSGLGRLLLVQKHNGALLRKTGDDASVPLLPGFEEKPQFTF